MHTYKFKISSSRSVTITATPEEAKKFAMKLKSFLHVWKDGKQLV